MEANSTVFHHWDDVVFENRNKNYGAYPLRRAYADRLMSGLVVTILVVGAILSLYNVNTDNSTREVMPVYDPFIFDVKPRPIIEPRVIPQNTIRERSTTARNRTVLVTKNEVIEKEEEIEAVEDFASVEGTGLGDVETITGAGFISMPDPAPVVENKVLDLAEVMPHYDGGLEAMMKFIQKKIRYPRAPRVQGIEGTVFVRFIVNGDGTVSDVEIIRGVHPDYDKEAKRVISLLPSWIGGSHHGRPVSVRMVLPIRFDLKI